MEFLLHLFGKHLAQREGYKANTGLDAVRFHLVQKHHWTPAQARALSVPDLEWLLSEDMVDWNAPEGSLE